jgi:hypothetical protein
MEGTATFKKSKLRPDLELRLDADFQNLRLLAQPDNSEAREYLNEALRQLALNTAREFTEIAEKAVAMQRKKGEDRVFLPENPV